MGTEAYKLKIRVVRLALNENEVGPDVAVAMITPLARQRMIEGATGQGPVRGEHVHDLHQQAVELLAVPSRLLAPIVPFEAVRVFNSPHSGSREDARARRR